MEKIKEKDWNVLSDKNRLTVLKEKLNEIIDELNQVVIQEELNRKKLSEEEQNEEKEMDKIVTGQEDV
jgi:hypothetical protein